VHPPLKNREIRMLKKKTGGGRVKASQKALGFQRGKVVGEKKGCRGEKEGRDGAGKRVAGAQSGRRKTGGGGGGQVGGGIQKGRRALSEHERGRRASGGMSRGAQEQFSPRSLSLKSY